MQKEHARKMSVENGEGHGFMETVKERYRENRDVENEYREGKKGEATEKAEKAGRYYHPFTGMTY
jgi:hypothetical protein